MTRGPRDKRMTIDDVVAELRDGMTIGIGGWGPRRKPMAIVRDGSAVSQLGFAPEVEAS